MRLSETYMKTLNLLNNKKPPYENNREVYTVLNREWI